MKRLISAIFAIVLALLTASAQRGVEVSLLTISPGDEMYQLEGHTALRLRFEDGEFNPLAIGYEDITVNWGVFDFNSPRFAYRFVKGETDYMIGIEPTDLVIYYYQHEHRGITEQVINLTDIEKARLIELIWINLQPQNRSYRYNYVKDNCATRPLDIIEEALKADGCKLVIDMPNVDTTFRREMRRYHKGYDAYQLFIDLVLGSGLDYEITPREQAFAPVFLEDLVAHSRIVAPNGQSRPLAQPAFRIVTPTLQPSGMMSPLWVLLPICLLSVIIAVSDLRRSKITIWWDIVFFGLIGVLSLLLTFLIFISTHEATSPNINYLWCNPLSLLFALTVGFRRGRLFAYWLQMLNFAMSAIYLCGMPLWHQAFSFMFLPMILPAMLLELTYIVIYRHTRIGAKPKRQAKRPVKNNRKTR